MDQDERREMENNLDDARQYFEGLDYPASKGEVADGARENGAPDDLVERVQTLSTPEFSGPEHVVEELRAMPSAG